MRTFCFLQNPQVQTRKEEAGLGQTAKYLASFLGLFQSLVLLANSLLQEISTGGCRNCEYFGRSCLKLGDCKV